MEENRSVETADSGDAKDTAGIIAEAEEESVPFLKGVKAEFKRITWLSKGMAWRQTWAVIIVAVLLGAFIAVLDLGIRYGLGFIL